MFLAMSEAEASLTLDKFNELHMLLVEFKELANGDPSSCLAWV
jgi:hypothetical protein